MRYHFTLHLGALPRAPAEGLTEDCYLHLAVNFQPHLGISDQGETHVQEGLFSMKALRLSCAQVKRLMFSAAEIVHSEYC